MALGATMYVFNVELADSDRGVYETLEIRAAQHPSEAADYLLTRLLAYCLEYQDGIGFSKGLSDPDEPTVFVRDLTGALQLWIEIGTPDADACTARGHLLPQGRRTSRLEAGRRKDPPARRAGTLCHRPCLPRGARAQARPPHELHADGRGAPLISDGWGRNAELCRGAAARHGLTGAFAPAFGHRTRHFSRDSLGTPVSAFAEGCLD